MASINITHPIKVRFSFVNVHQSQSFSYSFVPESVNTCMRLIKSRRFWVEREL